MASKATGTTAMALDPRTFGGSRGLALVASGAVQQVAFAEAARTKASEGVTLAEARVRLLASHSPLWAREVGAADFGFMVGRAPAGKVGVAMHAYRHTSPKGQREACVGGHGVAGESCKATAPSAGDGMRRYRTDDAYGPAPEYDGNMPRTIALAAAWLAECATALQGRGASKASMLATPSLKAFAAMSPAFAAAIEGKPAAPRASRTAKPTASKPAPAKPARASKATTKA